MLHSFFAGVIFGTALVAAAQQPKAVDLSSYSHSQLVACADDVKRCGARSAMEVSNELASRMPKQSTAELVRCFSDWKICGGERWQIADELRSRGHADGLVLKYGHDADPLVRNGIELVAYSRNSKVAHAYLRDIFEQKLDDGDNLYWPAMYLAKNCDRGALAHLNPGIESKSIADDFSVSSAMFAETVELFGKCHYRSAIPYMAQIGMYAASLNMVDAAERSLRKFYPNAPKFDSLPKEQKYWCDRVKRDGFKLRCPEE